jgi:2-(1,2-epoxy-1,2-dihydrophenyl)acetyl-CoA isomerase
MTGVARARDLLLTGRVLSADEAERWGSGDQVVADDDLYPATAAAVRELLRAGPDATVHVRRDR